MKQAGDVSISIGPACVSKPWKHCQSQLVALTAWNILCYCRVHMLGIADQLTVFGWPGMPVNGSSDLMAPKSILHLGENSDEHPQY
jgi:hypothetical protein